LLDPGRLSAALILLVATVLLMVFPDARAESSSVQVQSGTDWTPLELSSPDTRYPLASMAHTSGFIPAPADLALEQAFEQPPAGESFGLAPNFREHSRYWLYTDLRNRSDTEHWMLHISNFGFLDPRVLIRSSDGQVIRTFSNAGARLGTDINTLGRAVRIELEPGKSYQLVIELTAFKAAWQPYIGLMSETYYQGWKTTQDLIYKTGVGILVGLIVLGFICSLITREAVVFWGSLSALLMLVYHLEHSSLPALLWQSSYEKTRFFWVLMCVAMLSQLAFAFSFLKINRTSGRWFYAFSGAMLATGLFLFVSLLLSFEASIRLISFNQVLVAVVILGSGLDRVRSEGSYYVLYLIGWFPMVLSVLLVAWVVQTSRQPDAAIRVSYQMIVAVYIQVVHLLVHAVALIQRLRALREQKLRAEYLSLAKSRFIAQSSHDLAQPLQSMGVFLSYLTPHIRGREGEKVFQQLRNSHHQMNESFRSIMDLSKLEAGVIRPEFRAVALPDLFSRLAQAYRPLAEEKGLELRFSHCSLSVYSDPALLERMLRNLLSNAIKYTDQGKVLVGARRRDQGVILQVLDSGRGIEASAQEAIFDIYHRATDAAGPSAGSGVGLSIVRHLSGLLNHPVTLASLPGRGSVFGLTLPIGNPVEVEAPLPRSVVALVSRNPPLVETVTACMGRWQQPLRVFSSLEALRRSNATFAVLLCDSDSLEETELSYDQAHRLAEYSLLACVCDPDTPLPEPWVRLSPQALPAQLRALLNAAERQGKAADVTDSPGVPNPAD